MTSTPSSRSEGEVLTSDTEKATQTLPSHSGISVDRPPSKYASSARSSRSRSRSRTRSPYRLPRGEKRHRIGRDVDDPPRSGPQSQSFWNDERGVGRVDRRPHDVDRRPRKRVHRSEGPYSDTQFSSNRRRSNSRTRSRSPFRHSRLGSNSDQPDTLIRENSRTTEHIAQTSGNGTSRGSRWPVRGHNSSRDIASITKPISKSPQAGSLQVEPKKSSSRVPREYVSPESSCRDPDDVTSIQSRSLASNEPETTSSGVVVSEVVLIEERRRRREALKEKYRSQQMPLIVQALHLGPNSTTSATTPISSPQIPEEPITATPLSPEHVWSLRKATRPTSPPASEDAPESPAEISVEYGESFANVHLGSLASGEEEPSAADYDPTVDMQEERARHEKRLLTEANMISADEDMRAEGSGRGDDTAPAKPTPQLHKEESENHEDRFDMFAEDDTIDMFAEATLYPKAMAAVADAKIAQSLDVKMMDNWDDSEGYYTTIPGELFESRYHVLQNLGRGMFSSVVRATDTKTNKLVAIKIVRNNDTMRKAGMKEIEILKDLAGNDPEDKRHVVRLERSFEHKGHLCMVFENLSLNLREVLKKFGRDVGINLKAIRAYAQQLFIGLSLLRKCQYLHADLKPDNILVNEARNVLKICDLGSASSIDENLQAPYLVSRFYRAPEIILGIPYDYGIDIWSIGCTLFELYTGKILFTGRNNNGMLRSIMECRGKFPHKVLRRGNLTHQYFDDLLNFQAIEEDHLTGRKLTKMIDIKAKPIKALRERLVPKGKKMDEQERREVELFADLLDKCLDLRGDKRITPPDALKHPFIARAKA